MVTYEKIPVKDDYYFNLPQITQLTIPQQAAVADTQSIALSGGPGTGKSVVSLWRHIQNHNNGKRSLLLTYTTTLKQYLTACCRTQNDNASNYIGTTYSNRPNTQWREIIVDEAQDMDNDYYRTIRKYGQVSYGADDSQILYLDHCSRQRELHEIFPGNNQHVLNRNFRSTQRIMKFAQQAFPNANIPQTIINGLANNIGEFPVFLISNGSKYDRTNQKQNDAIKRIIDSFHAADHNIAILVPWKSDVNVFENVLDSMSVRYSVYYDDRSRFPNGFASSINNIHLTTFKSAKGLEFDTVIIPNFHKYTEICGSFNTEWNDYYVACTRARSNLYLISNNDMPNLDLVIDKEEL